MTSPALITVWAPILALLGTAITVLAILVALLQLRNLPAVWRRTVCEASLVAVLAISGCELSGAADALADWTKAALVRLRLAVRAGHPAETVPAEISGVQREAPDRVMRAPNDERGDREASVKSVETRLATSAINFPEKASNRGGTPSIPPAAVSHGTGGTSELLLVLWLGFFWPAGSLFVAGRVCLARWVCLLLQRARPPNTDSTLGSQAESLSRRLGLTRPVRIIESARLTSPVAFGWLRPTIGLPPDFLSGLSPVKQEVVLAHELAHLAAHDPFWSLVADLAAALFWWHPCVWWLRKQLRLACELAADEASLLVSEGPPALAECLVELGARLVERPVFGQLHAGGYRSQLAHRVQHLLLLEAGFRPGPPRFQRTLAKSCGPIALTLLAALASAWVVPQPLTKGDSMKTMRLTWKRTANALTILSALSFADFALAADAPEEPAAGPASAAVPSQSTDANEAKAQEAFRQRFGLVPTPESTNLSRARKEANEAADAAFRARYGLTRSTRGLPAEQPPGGELGKKLKAIQVANVTYNDLPLSEVLRNLDDLAQKLDPEKKGVNFLLSNARPPLVSQAAIDPNTGLPIADSSEPMDLGSVIIKITMPLRNISMKDLLDAIVKAADSPIEYSVQDYAVVFSHGAGFVPGPPRHLSTGHGATGGRSVQMFKLDAKQFVAAAQVAFSRNIELSTNASPMVRSAQISNQVSNALLDLLDSLGAPKPRDPTEWLVYNDLTGVIMVHGRPETLEVARGLVLTLGGTEFPPTLSRASESDIDNNASPSTSVQNFKTRP